MTVQQSMTQQKIFLRAQPGWHAWSTTAKKGMPCLQRSAKPDRLTASMRARITAQAQRQSTPRPRSLRTQSVRSMKHRSIESLQPRHNLQKIDRARSTELVVANGLRRQLSVGNENTQRCINHWRWTSKICKSVLVVVPRHRRGHRGMNKSAGKPDLIIVGMECSCWRLA